MTQKPPPRRTTAPSSQTRTPNAAAKPATSTSKPATSTTKTTSKPSSSTASSSKSSQSSKSTRTNKSKSSRLPLTGGLATGCLLVVGLIVACLVGGYWALNLNEEEGQNTTQPTSRAPLTPGPTRDLGGSTGLSDEADWYQIYFTEASCPSGDQQVGGLDEYIAETIAFAEISVDIAIYELNSEPITQALIDARQRGVAVRVVTDTDYESRSSIARLRRNGISVATDDRSAFMHNKFTIIDGRYVWTGSMNYMPNDIFCNNNNLVWFDSPQLAENYTVEMNEMFVDRSFGPRSPINTPAEQFIQDGIYIENYFAPETKVAPIIGELVQQAESEILFLAFSFTHEDIGEAMLEQADAGIKVQGVFERTGSEQPFSYYTIMKEENLPTVQIRQDGNPRVMHHKFIVIDRQTVIFGSFNFTANANNNNDENLVVVHDPTFASYFVDEFFAVWDSARQP